VLGGSDKYEAVLEGGSAVSPRQEHARRGRLIQVAVGSVTAFADLQKRAAFDPHNDPEDARLVESVREYGVIQPIAVVKPDQHTTQLVYGHRRYAAAEAAGLESVPALLHPSGAEPLVLDIQTAIENFHRRDLNPIEQASLVQAFKDRYGYSQREIARILLLSPAQVNMLFSLLDAPDEVVQLVAGGDLGVRNAYEVLKLPEREQHKAVEAIRAGISAAGVFAQLEASAGSDSKKSSAPRRAPKSPSWGLNFSSEVLAALVGDQGEAFERSCSCFGKSPIDETTQLLVAAIAAAAEMSWNQAAAFVSQQMTRQFRREAVRALDLMARMSAYYALADPGEVAPVFLAFSAAAQILAEQGDE
jgi:ParB/RepB/Spo0J family partition protein